MTTKHKLMFFLFILFAVILAILDMVHTHNVQEENMVKATIDKFNYDTVYYFQYYNHELQIKFTNGQVYYVIPRYDKDLNLYFDPDAYLDKNKVNNGVKIGDVLYKDSNSNEVYLIRNNSSTIKYRIWADDKNPKWRAKHQSNENIY